MNLSSKHIRERFPQSNSNSVIYLDAYTFYMILGAHFVNDIKIKSHLGNLKTNYMETKIGVENQNFMHKTINVR